MATREVRLTLRGGPADGSAVKKEWPRFKPWNEPAEVTGRYRLKLLAVAQDNSIGGIPVKFFSKKVPDELLVEASRLAYFDQSATRYELPSKVQLAELFKKEPALVAAVAANVDEATARHNALKVLDENNDKGGTELLRYLALEHDPKENPELQLAPYVRGAAKAILRERGEKVGY